MLREERDPDFWRAVADHPMVEHIKFGHEVDVGELAERRDILPLASQNGGFLLRQLDAFGLAFELHTLFTPEGWGREVAEAAKDMFETIFAQAALIITHETTHPQSKPPLSYGWKRAGEGESEIGEVGLWILTKEAWEQSPAGRRRCRYSVQ